MPEKDVVETVSVGAEVAFLAFIPYCNRCGLCCERLITWQMTQVDPDDPKTTPPGLFRGTCIYLDGKPGVGKITSCKITDGSVTLGDLPQYHQDYYNRNCSPFDANPDTWPNRKDENDWATDGSYKPIGVEDVCSFRRVKWKPAQ